MMTSTPACIAAFTLTMLYASWLAYDIRLYAIREYGYVIHEFDPWFNYRATEYLDEHGWTKFFHWFDYESWYPLGRPVGTTIYPGMQISSVVIKRTLNALGNPISLNDVCCMVPAWFGVSATWFLALFTSECSGSLSAGAFAGLIMSIVPCHIMRSVGGGYDNESVAMTAMCATFYCWVRALRFDPTASDGVPSRSSIIFGVLCGLAYVYMAAAWGGFVFVVNMIGLHAALLVPLGRYSTSVHRAYTLFFIIGTFGATRVPPVGMNPFKSMEQLMPLAVFIGYQVLEAVQIQRRKHSLSVAHTIKVFIRIAVPLACVLLVVCYYLLSIGYFGPLTARVRGLFVRHTRTGNPLVDSVAEHQPGSTAAYQQYMHHVYRLAPIGFLLLFSRWSDSSSFLLLYAYTAYFFASKMSRLIILLGPVASALGGVTLGYAFDYLLISALVEGMPTQEAAGKESADDKTAKAKAKAKKEADEKAKKAKAEKAERETSLGKKGKGGKKKGFELDDLAEALAALKEPLAEMSSSLHEKLHDPASVKPRLLAGLVLTFVFFVYADQFYQYSHMFAERSSSPQIMFKARLQNNKEIIVDDYREAYHWLRDHTPEDSRIMAWWDYGYQITGIGKRTSIADGNTWNHEHIATLGRILTAPEAEAHSLARHLADYVLVWAGGGGDDLAKSPHLARIGNSVYPGHCSDPTCSQFGFHQDRSPTPMMAESLLFKMCMAGQMGVTVNETFFQLAFTSKYGKVRVFKVKKVSKKSKDWVADPANRVCDAPGSWFCSGQYPPALQEFISKRRDFKQLEDFNVKKDTHSQKYHEEYMRRMGGG
jgi:dolichyl-diphosphooligosaccharide---protein glycosyltransferase